MLSHPGRALVAAVAPTARVAHLGAAAATVAVAAIPVLVTLARGDPVAATPVVIACLAGGATLGWASDDPCADLLAAMPISTPSRLALRILLATAVVVVGVAIIALLVGLGPGLPPDRGDHATEAAAAAAIALGIGLLAARHGERAAGPIGVTGGVLAPALVAALAYRWPNVLPTFGPGPIHERWWLVVVAGAAIAMNAGRDPGRGRTDRRHERDRRSRSGRWGPARSRRSPCLLRSSRNAPSRSAFPSPCC